MWRKGATQNYLKQKNLTWKGKVFKAKILNDAIKTGGK